MNKLRHFIFILLFIPSLANASIYFEPFFGLESGSDGQQATVSGSTSSSTTINRSGTFGSSTDGLAYGFKLGQKFSNFFYFFEYYLSSTSTSDFAASTGYFAVYDSSKTNISLNLGIDFPWVPYVWAGYILGAENELEGYGITNVYKGKGVQFGLGFGQMVRLSIVTYKITYDERDGASLPTSYSIQSGDVDLDVEEKELETDGIIISLGIPFEF